MRDIDQAHADGRHGSGAAREDRAYWVRAGCFECAVHYAEDGLPHVCLDRHQGDCAGPVEYRMPLSGTGRSFPRCEKHWQRRLDKQQEIDRRYPDSPFPPADFDPAYAGESWDGE